MSCLSNFLFIFCEISLKFDSFWQKQPLLRNFTKYIFMFQVLVMKLCVRYGRLSWLAHCVVSLSLISVSSADSSFSSRHSGGEQQDNALQPVAPGGCVPFPSLNTTPRATRFIHTFAFCFIYKTNLLSVSIATKGKFMLVLFVSALRIFVVLILLVDVTKST